MHRGVLIHISFPGKTGDLIKYASAYAVPIFFLIAGYFAFGKMWRLLNAG